MSNISRQCLIIISAIVAISGTMVEFAEAKGLTAGAGFREGRFLLAPQAFLTFCRVHPGECPEQGGEAVLALDAELETLLRDVNGRVNRKIAPVALAGPDVWALGRRTGHCATFAVEKRHELLQAGLPAGAVSLAVVTTSWGELHLVVAVRTDAGTLVLDNLRAEIRPWLATGYRFEKVQSAANPSFWVSVSGPAAPETDRVFAWSAARPNVQLAALPAAPAVPAVSAEEVGSPATPQAVVRLIPTPQDGVDVAVLVEREDGTS